MLARFEEAIFNRSGDRAKKRMSAIECLLADLFDYAGLFPPACIDMHSAIRNYLEYRCGSHQRALGRFVVDLDRFPSLCDAAGDYVRTLRLSLLAAVDSDWSEVQRILDQGYRIETIEIKPVAPAEIHRVVMEIPAGPDVYFEVPWNLQQRQMLDAIAAAGGRAKVRMGGTQPDAFPSTSAVTELLKELAGRRLAFKATAGLHHPMRARHSLTNAPESPMTTMHGFVNFACAAALAFFGGEDAELHSLLDEEDHKAWRVENDSIAWRSRQWSAGQFLTLRKEFLISVGSCSFTEPIHDLEALRWL
jgi:hypothetical protein